MTTSTTPITIQSYQPEDRATVLRLLTNAELPTDDLDDELLSTFLIARTPEGKVVGSIGMQSFEEGGLLRSLVVDPAYRGRGLGQALIDAMESQATDQDLDRVYLLTQTIDEYLKHLGYHEFPRQDVPDPILQTQEFQGLCPDSAVCMSKQL
ncbi:MAG: arsenic resistance N-acetyltransferase ArsN2 [Bacteroidota bacterium]